MFVKRQRSSIGRISYTNVSNVCPKYSQEKLITKIVTYILFIIPEAYLSVVFRFHFYSNVLTRIFTHLAFPCIHAFS